jgi:hypothetical protein
MHKPSGEQVKLCAYGAIAGAVGIMIAGSFWPGWSTESTVQKRLATRDNVTLVRVLGPVCAKKFREQPDLTASVAELKKIDSWRRDDYLVKSHYVIPTGAPSTDTAIGDACANLLSDLTK